MSELGVAQTDAREGTLSTEYAASKLRDLPTDFESLVTDAESALKEDPGADDVWGSFGSKNTDHMNDVAEHAETLAQNIGTTLDDVAHTEDQSVDDYHLARPPNAPGTAPQLF